MADRKKIAVPVPSKGGEAPTEDGPPAPKQPELPPIETELSAEDLALKESLELAVERCGDSKAGVVAAALELMRKEIREATASMTSVPKPLKFLNPHFAKLKDVHKDLEDGDNRRLLADIVSVLGMIHTADGKRDTLNYKLKGNTKELEEWGHEYVRSLAGQIGQEFEERQLKDPVPPCDDLLGLVHTIVPFHFKHNAEPEAIDLLMETSAIDSLRTSGLVDKLNYSGVCLYMLQCAEYLDDKEEVALMIDICQELYLSQGQYCDALRVALKMQDRSRAAAVFEACTDAATQKQMALILGRHRIEVQLDDEDTMELAGNNTLSENFAALARELDVAEPKSPEQIYKSHLSETGTTARDDGSQHVESARSNLASTFVNAFVNAGYCNDLLMSPQDSKWVHKNQGYGQVSATASYGMVLLWSMDNLTKLDKYLYAQDENQKAGALLSVGIACASVRNEMDPALALLTDYLEEDSDASPKLKSTALLALGIAYAGTWRDDVQDMLQAYIEQDDDEEGEGGKKKKDDAPFELCCLASLALGMIFVGSGDDDVALCITNRLMDATDAERNQAIARHMCLGLALVFLGKEEAASAIVEAVKAVEHPISNFAAVLVQTCAYAGTGNVLQVQKLLHKCAEHPDEKATEEEKAAEGMVQSAAVLGIALVTMGEELGVEMASRSAEHLLAYGDQAVRRSVPLAMALHHIGTPDYTVVDTLGKLTHDQDAEVSQNAILALGFVGAGTNNSRIAGLLRMLVAFYKNEHSHIFCVRIAQGLLHMGKGLISINPFHSDRLLFSHAALAGILPVLLCGLDLKATIHGDRHWLLYTLATAMMPRMLVIVDEDMKPMHIDVRVGTAVDTVGQAGKPKTITGFQTHESPVLLAAGERAQLATNEYIPCTSVLEGLVIVKPNPDWDPEVEAKGGYSMLRAKAKAKAKKRAAAQAAAAAGSGGGAGGGAGAGSGAQS